MRASNFFVLEKARNTTQASVVICMPHRAVFNGTPATTLDEAEENAAQASLDHMVSSCNIEMNDYSFK